MSLLDLGFSTSISSRIALAGWLAILWCCLVVYQQPSSTVMFKRVVVPEHLDML